jgi:cardiolipin synthase
MFTIPNLLSLLRMGIVPLFIIAVVNGDLGKALALFVIAGVTDALDGFIARFWGQQSPLGAYLDPIADKLLLTSSYIALSIPSLNRGTEIPIWVTVLVIARDVLIVVIALVLHLAVGVRAFPPSVIGKVTTVVQVSAVALVLMSGTFRQVRWIDLCAYGAVYLVAILTVVSGLVYIFRASRMEARHRP